MVLPKSANSVGRPEQWKHIAHHLILHRIHNSTRRSSARPGNSWARHLHCSVRRAAVTKYESALKSSAFSAKLDLGTMINTSMAQEKPKLVRIQYLHDKALMTSM